MEVKAEPQQISLDDKSAAQDSAAVVKDEPMQVDESSTGMSVC